MQHNSGYHFRVVNQLVAVFFFLLDLILNSGNTKNKLNHFFLFLPTKSGKIGQLITSDIWFSTNLWFNWFLFDNQTNTAFSLSMLKSFKMKHMFYTFGPRAKSLPCLCLVHEYHFNKQKGLWGGGGPFLISMIFSVAKITPISRLLALVSLGQDRHICNRVSYFSVVENLI